MNELNQIKELLLAITKEAGEYALSHFDFDRKSVIYKVLGKFAPVTPVDLEIDRRLRRQIAAKFSHHSIISEENTALTKDGEYTWIIDPIDGTGNYIRKNENYSISVAVAINNLPIMAVIYAPTKNEFYFAEKGKGVQLNERPLLYSSNADIEPVCYSRPQEVTILKERLGQEIRVMPHLHCATLELTDVAQGKADCLLYRNINNWDYAAGTLIVEEMGGRVEDLSQKPYTLDSRNLFVIGRRFNIKV